MPNTPEFDVLVQAERSLESGTEEARQKAMRAIADLVRSQGSLSANSLKVLIQFFDTEIAVAAEAEALVGIHGITLTDEIVKLFQAEVASTRKNAALSIDHIATHNDFTEIQIAELTQGLAPLLSDPHRDVQQAAALSLASLNDASSGVSQSV
jgi:hypothetical protein